MGSEHGHWPWEVRRQWPTGSHVHVALVNNDFWSLIRTIGPELASFLRFPLLRLAGTRPCSRVSGSPCSPCTDHAITAAGSWGSWAAGTRYLTGQTADASPEAKPWPVPVFSRGGRRLVSSTWRPPGRASTGQILGLCWEQQVSSAPCWTPRGEGGDGGGKEIG